jgi:hypothetical protein
LIKKFREKNIAKQAIIDAITIKIAFESQHLNVTKSTFINQIYIVFNIKNKINIYIKLLRITTNLILVYRNI